jgi:hypothetical protein
VAGCVVLLLLLVLALEIADVPPSEQSHKIITGGIGLLSPPNANRSSTSTSTILPLTSSASLKGQPISQHALASVHRNTTSFGSIGGFRKRR